MSKEPATEFFMELNDAKVLKRFGKHPERGKLLRGHTTRVKRPRQRFERVSDAYDLRQPMLQLKLIRKGWWLCCIDQRYAKDARYWLNKFCT
jgi:hypothetical protein